MGNLVSSAGQLSTSSLPSPAPLRILVYGPKGSGKTSLLTHLKKSKQGSGDIKHETPTIGVETETLELAGNDAIILTTINQEYMWTRWGKTKEIEYRQKLYQEADAIAFVVDSDSETMLPNYTTATNNNERSRRGKRGSWEVARSQLHRLLQTYGKNTKKPILLLCNKQDLPTALAPNRLANLLGVTELSSSRPTLSLGCSSIDGDDDETDGISTILDEGFEWLKMTLRTPSTVVVNLDDAKCLMKGANNASTTSSSSTPTTTTVTTQDTDSITTNSGGGSKSNDDGTASLMLNYEPTLLGGNVTLQRFEGIKQGTQCPFARSAKLWGGMIAPNYDMSIKEVAAMHAKPLAEFVSQLKTGEKKLDGFCIQLHNHSIWNEKTLARAVHETLNALSEYDPSRKENENLYSNCMVHEDISKETWCYRFANENFFITTFSPFYPETSSRYSFHVYHSFMLLQPMSSFARHKLPADTPHSATNWENPTTIRDKTRVAFRDAGRPYYIPETLPYPVAEHIVKPKFDDGTNVIRWWEEPLAKQDEEGGEKKQTRNLVSFRDIFSGALENK